MITLNLTLIEAEALLKVLQAHTSGDSDLHEVEAVLAQVIDEETFVDLGAILDISPG